MALITPTQRLAALHSAKNLLTGGESTALFSKTSPPAPNPLPMIRIAEYILTGVDYRDTTPESASDIHGHHEHEEPKEDVKEDEEVKSPIIMTHEEWVNSGGEEGPHANDGVLVMPPEKTDEKGGQW